MELVIQLRAASEIPEGALRSFAAEFRKRTPPSGLP
jgi:hypothetical protein